MEAAWLALPLVEGSGKETSLVHGGQDGPEELGVGEGVMGGCKSHTLSVAAPQVFDGGGSVPGGFQAFLVAFEIFRFNVPVGGIQMV